MGQLRLLVWKVKITRYMLFAALVWKLYRQTIEFLSASIASFSAWQLFSYGSLDVMIYRCMCVYYTHQYWVRKHLPISVFFAPVVVLANRILWKHVQKKKKKKISEAVEPLVRYKYNVIDLLHTYIHK